MEIEDIYEEFDKEFIEKSTSYLHQESLDTFFIKGHIILENYIDRIIEHSSESKFDISKTNFTFKQKIDVLIILSYFSKDSKTYEILTKFNSLRNKFAHKLDVDRESVDNLMRIEFIETNVRHDKALTNDDYRVFVLIMLLVQTIARISAKLIMTKIIPDEESKNELK